VIAATPLLQEYVLPKNPATIQLDSFFDFRLAPTIPRRPSRRMVRGGFAASTARGHDLREVIDDVLAILEAHDDVEFEIIGAKDDAIPPHPRIRRFSYRPSYHEYIAFQRSRTWDFGLAPLGGAASNLYKTDNKYREYAAQGVPGIYQEAAPYARVRDGETGLIAGGRRTWREAMEILIGDPELRGRIRLAARADAERRLALANVAPQWAAFFAAAPAIGGDDARLERARREIAPPPTARQRAMPRARLLWEYGLASIEHRGVLNTAGRTVRFLAKKAIGR
jgi:glycosyltransferase involved in cell wall biosynthesis